MLLQRAEKLLGADTAAILLVDRDGSQLIARSARGLEDEVRQGVRVPLGMGFAGQIAATRAPVVLDDVGPHTVVNPILWKHGVCSMLGVPLIADGRLLGVMHVGSLHRRHFSDDDSAMLEREAARVARVVSEHQVSSERLAARTLQEHLLPVACRRSTGSTSPLASSPLTTSASAATGSTCSGFPTVVSAW